MIHTAERNFTSTATARVHPASRVHPSFLPYLQKPHAPMRAAKWIPPMVAAACVGYSISTYRQASHDARLEMESAALEEERRRRAKNESLMEAYGGRDSLAALEQAIQAYEAQREEGN